MNGDLRIPHHDEFGNIRTILINSEPWFVGKDVAAALGYKNTKDAIATHISDEDRKIIQRSEIATFENHLGENTFSIKDIPNRGLTIINESGLYSLIFSSKLDSAIRFKHWVTSEVLPSSSNYHIINPSSPLPLISTIRILTLKLLLMLL